MPVFFAKFIGILAAVFGTVFIFRPNRLRRILLFWEKERRLYIAGAIRVAIAVFILLASPESRYPVVIAAVGILILINGLSLFILGLDRVKVMLRWWCERPLSVLRFMALMAIGFGALILYCA